MDTNTHNETVAPEKKDVETKVEKKIEVGRYLTPIAVVLGSIIIAAAFYFGHGSVPTPTGQPIGSGQAQAVAVNIKDVKIAGEPYVGSKNAPVTIALWFDYQCPFCKLLDDNTIKKVYPKYVQTGKVKIVFKDFAFLGPDSDTAGLFARAVWDLYPDKFYAWYQAMFSAQDKENTGFGDLASIEKLAKSFPGIDEAKVVAQMNSHKSKYTAVMSADRAEGSKFGVRGTPSMIIGNKLIVGAEPYSVVSAAIDAQLKKAK